MAKKITRQHRKQRTRLKNHLSADLKAAKANIDAQQFGAAIRLVEGVLEQSPKCSPAHQLAATLAFCHGNFELARSHLEVAIKNDKKNTGYLFDIALMYSRLGMAEEEIRAYRKIIRLKPRSAIAYANLGFIYRRRGDFDAALLAFGRAVEIDPEHVGAQTGWIHLLGRIRTEEFDSKIADALVKAFESPYTHHPSLAPATASMLNLKYGFAQYDPEINGLPQANDPLLAGYLSKCVNIELGLESGLTRLRKFLLFGDWVDEHNSETKLAVLLARQGFINEFVFHVTPVEKERIYNLQQELEDMLSADNIVIGEMEDRLLRFAMYESFNRLQGASRLAELDDKQLGPNLVDLVTLTLRDALEEEAIWDSMPALKRITDSTSQAVQQLYEENPCPRWLHLPRRMERLPAAWLREMFPGFSPPSFLRPESNILIAGCGTGQQAISVALEFPRADITAIDISRASLAYAARMAKKLDIGNIRFLHADILDAGLLDQSFDMIQSVGVLHHMRTPLDGWRVLTGLLREGGVFKAGLYAERGRQGVVKCREMIAREGIGSSHEEIVDFRYRLMNESVDRKLFSFMERIDFFTTSMCRDLLFHVQEIRYTPKQLKDELDAVGLEFIGFEGLEETGMVDVYQKAFPHEPDMSNLDNWERLEMDQEDPPEGYMFWCHKPGE